MGPSFPSQKGVEQPPLFGPCLLWQNGWMHQDAICYGGRPWSGHVVLDGKPSPPKGAQPLQLLAHVCCGQTDGWINMPLGTELGLGPGDIVLDRDRAPTKRGHSLHFSVHVYCGQSARWIKMPLGTKVGLGAGHIVTLC